MPSTPDAERLRLEAIAERVRRVLTWTEGLNEAEFVADLMLRDACALALMVIGETARRLGDDVKGLMPQVPWKSVVALRNRIAHGYETVDHRLVWEVIALDLAPLLKAVDAALSTDDSRQP